MPEDLCEIEASMDCIVPGQLRITSCNFYKKHSGSILRFTSYKICFLNRSVILTCLQGLVRACRSARTFPFSYFAL